MVRSVSMKRSSVASEASSMGVWDVPSPSTILAIVWSFDQSIVTLAALASGPFRSLVYDCVAHDILTPLSQATTRGWNSNVVRRSAGRGRVFQGPQRGYR